jgi:hypothetical protein
MLVQYLTLITTRLGSYTQLWCVAIIICIKQKGRGEQDMRANDISKGNYTSLKAAYAAYWASFGVVV